MNRAIILSILISVGVTNPAFADDCSTGKQAKIAHIKCLDKKISSLNERNLEINNKIVNMHIELEKAEKRLIDMIRKYETVQIKSVKTNECIYEADNHGLSLRNCNENGQRRNDWNLKVQ